MVLVLYLLLYIQEVRGVHATVAVSGLNRYR